MIELRLLGPVEATVDGEAPPAELLWRKHVALVAHLALAPGMRAGREQLTGLLWGDKPESAARHSLAEALRIVRRCTDEGVEDTGSGYVRLTAGAVETDTARFDTHMDVGDPAAAAALVAGEFMEGFALPDAWEFEEWLAEQRRSWRSRSEEALVGAADAALAAGEPERAHELARRALRLVPTSDTACQAAMRALCLRGDRARALETYSAFAAWLEEELEIEPAEETAALAERVRRQRRWRLPAERRAREPRGAESRRAPLVGRGSELGALVDAWRACLGEAGGRTAVIAGDAGTGRTRLLEELMERARLDGATTALVRALPADRASDGAVLEALARTVPFDPAARGLSLIHGLEAAVEAAPLVLAVDDAVWMDELSLAELTALAPRASGSALMVLFVTGRSSERPELEQLSADLGRDVPGVLVRLDPLEEQGLRELASWALPDYDDEAAERLARRLVADTAGYPLLALELLHAVAHGMTLDAGRPPWPAPGRTLDETRPGDLPETLVSAVRVGFRVLTAAAQKAAAAVAVLDAPVPEARIARAIGLDSAELQPALDELEWERWLTADARGYGFLARLVREIVARDMITEGQRQRILGSGP